MFEVSDNQKLSYNAGNKLNKDPGMVVHVR